MCLAINHSTQRTIHMDVYRRTY
uniref:Uncharacterized protein n=1 Tax=Phlebotomus papatasi TaxID=29031 RepID=A0A1B0GPJ1_PHLPP